MSGVVEREREFYDELWSRLDPRTDLGTYRFPGIEDLRDKRILICGCGTGVEAVRAAKTGAAVFAFDISPVAIEKTRELAAANGVRLMADVMDFHRLEYQENFFDLASGTAILHHVDCDLAGRELYRVLRPGGIARFWKNSDGNPLIRWFRRGAFGVPGGYQRQRFLLIKRIGTTDEYPLSEEEVSILRRIFRGNVRVTHDVFVFFTLIARHVWNNRALYSLMRQTDALLAKVYPSLLKYSFQQTIWLVKPLEHEFPGLDR